MGRRVRIVTEAYYDDDYITLEGVKNILGSYDRSDLADEYLEGEFSFCDDKGDEPLVREDTVALTIVVKGPKSVLAGCTSAYKLKDLFYGIEDAGIAEIVHVSDVIVRNENDVPPGLRGAFNFEG